MAWRDNLLPASYKGAKFYVQTDDYKVGRRNAVHEYANRESPYVQDLGKMAEEFTINGYIINNSENDFNYLNQRNVLIHAFSTFGAGVLVHPDLGIKKVSLKGGASFKSDRITEGGMVRFTATFIESGQRLPNILKQGKATVDATVNVGQDLAGDIFGDMYLTNSPNNIDYQEIRKVTGVAAPTN